jgi:serine protease Do
MNLRRPLLSVFGMLISTLSLAAVVEIVPPQIPAKTPIDVSTKQITRTVEFSAWKVNVDPIDIVGTEYPGIFCSGPVEQHYWTKLGDWLRGATREQYFKKALTLGYPKHQVGESAFEEKLGSEADFRGGVTLLDIKYKQCGTGHDLKGTAYVKMKWELFSVLRQKVVYSKVVDASFDNSSGSGLSTDDFFRRMMDAEVNNLLADNDFVNTFVTGGVSNTSQSTLSQIALKSSSPAKFDVPKSSVSLQSSVVTIESGLGSGSGFFISDDGYLLTNEHVVGGAKFVKIKTIAGKSLIGQVIRIDSIRDVAVIKTESSDAPALSIRKTVPAVGEKVYAIGSPYGEELAGTLTQGVLSSRRTLEGVTYLQSDASVSSGNSGGPLIDSSGAVIGITQLQVGKSGGINLFIPIDEALEKLALSVN